jgi:hypothetical protein
MAMPKLFNGFRSTVKPLKRPEIAFANHTWLKPGVTESLVHVRKPILSCGTNVLIFCSALWFRDANLAGKMKYRVIHRHVRFDFINNDCLFVR